MNSHPEEEGRCKHENSDFKLWQEIGIIPAALLRYPSTITAPSIQVFILPIIYQLFASILINQRGALVYKRIQIRIQQITRSRPVSSKRVEIFLSKFIEHKIRISLNKPSERYYITDMFFNTTVVSFNLAAVYVRIKPSTASY